jgi:hypothetical protein
MKASPAEEARRPSFARYPACKPPGYNADSRAPFHAQCSFDDAGAHCSGEAERLDAATAAILSEKRKGVGAFGG